jgi:hypothetical protein
LVLVVLEQQLWGNLVQMVLILYFLPLQQLVVDMVPDSMLSVAMAALAAEVVGTVLVQEQEEQVFLDKDLQEENVGLAIEAEVAAEVLVV